MRMKAYDLLVQAGQARRRIRAAGRGELASVCDIATNNTALAIHEALWQREQTGRGEGNAYRCSTWWPMGNGAVAALDYLGKRQRTSAWRINRCTVRRVRHRRRHRADLD
jgi:hypothetical protein